MYTFRKKERFGILIHTFLFLITSSLFLMMSCQNSSESLKTSFPELLYQKASLEIIDTLILGSNEYFDPSSARLTYEKEEDFYCFVSKGGVVRVYNTAGDRVFLFDKKSLSNHFEFPNSLPAAYEFIPSENSMFLIFTGNPTLFKVNRTGEIMEKIELQLPEHLWFHRIPHLEFSSITNEISLSLGDISGVSNSEKFFSESPLIGVFKMNGKLKKTIGLFPKEFKDAGKFSTTPFQFYRYAIIDQKHHFLFDHEPFIRVYDSNEQPYLINVKGSQRDYSFNPSSIPHYSDEMPENATNDLNHFFTKQKDENIYFVGYQRLLASHNNTNVFLMKVDLNKNMALEVDLTKSLGVAFHPKLSGVIKSDTLEFFMSSPFSDEVKIIKAMIKED